MITKPVLVDAGPIVAALKHDEQHHEACVKQLRELSTPLFTCWPVLTEAAWLLRRHPERVRELLQACGGSPYQILLLDTNDVSALNGVLAKYEDQRIQLADACLLHLAERERIEHLFTLDRRDFTVFRTASNKSLELLP